MTSLAIHAVFIFILIAIPVAVHQTVTAPVRYIAVRLEDPPVSPPPAIKIPLPEPVVRRAPNKSAADYHREDYPPPLPVKPEVKPVLVEPPVIEPPVAIHPPEPKLEVAAPSPPKPVVVKTEVFAAVSAPPAGPKPAAHEIKLGGFGDPEGVPASATSAKGLTAARVGSFDLPSGPGQGGAAGHAKVVATAGFGDGASAAGSVAANGRASGAVHASGFGDYTASPASLPKSTAPLASAVTPVEITYKPKPAYTPEARQQKLEGEVQLDVIFSASGQVHVLRVVRGLGMGLDESARTAAAQIRFHPGTRDGSPVDMRGIVHIVFELS